jgi:FkbH-like protein
LDALVFVDDNPVECAAVRRALPEVDVIALPADPSHYVRTLSHYLLFETASFTDDDVRRTQQYQARAQAMRLEKTAASPEEFWESLDMTATIVPFDEIDLPRLVQLIGKTNQFNLTSRRHSQTHVTTLMQDPCCLHFSLRLRDRFSDHGLVGLMIALQREHLLEIDTWLLSCRVIGRTVEKTMLDYLCAQAALRGVTTVRGVYIPTAKNLVVKDLYAQLKFVPGPATADGQAWNYDLGNGASAENRFIKIKTTKEKNASSPAIGANL